jgi:hypothetical protein
MAKFFAFVLLFLPITAFGAVVPIPSLSPVISASPSYQTPGATVTLKAFLKSSEEKTLLYVWTVDGVETARGIDISEITINAGPAGVSKLVRVAVTDTDLGTAGQATYIIRPAEVDLVWEGDTYVPPFYRGKSFPTREGEIVVEAIPYILVNGARVSKNNLVFTWEVEGEKRVSGSGYGKSVFRTKPAQFRYSTIVTVTVSTQDGTLGARSSISIPTRSPGVVVYEEKPLAGTWLTKAAATITPLVGDEMAFKAVPFFVVNPQSLTYAWTLNREPFETSVNDRSVAVFRKTGAGEGQFPVSVTIQKPGSIFERASTKFDLSF